MFTSRTQITIKNKCFCIFDMKIEPDTKHCICIFISCNLFRELCDIEDHIEIYDFKVPVGPPVNKLINCYFAEMK